jgi:N-carbamoyl-L-amino-acid hydrolase
LERSVAEVKKIIREAGKREGVTVEIETLAYTGNAAFSEDMISLVENKARELGYSTKRMPSGAGHDAQIMQKICPSAMIFIPSQNGRSHCPEEYSSPEDVGNGADVLLHCLLNLLKVHQSSSLIQGKKPQ